MNTELMKSNESIIKAGRTIDETGKIDVSKLDSETIRKCREITKDIKTGEDLADFGTDLDRQGSEYGGKLLELNKLDKAGKAGEYIDDLVKEIRAIDFSDPDNLKGWRRLVAKIPVVGKTVAINADRILSDYDNSKIKVNKIVEKIISLQKDIDQDTNILASMAERTEDLGEYYRMHIVSLAVKVQDEAEKLNKMIREVKADPTTHSQEEIERQKDFVEKIDRRGFDMFMSYQKTVNLDRPQIIMMIKNSEHLKENNTDIIKHTIPSWEMSIATAIINRHQREILNIQRKVKDVNNKLTLNNAKMMKETSAAILVEGSRSVIDVETYNKALTDTVAALEESHNKLASLKKERDENREKIIKTNKEVSARLIKLSQESSQRLLEEDPNFISEALKNLENKSGE